MAIGNFRVLGAKTVPNLLDKVNRLDIVDDLTSGGTGAPLSAEQGKVLKGVIDTETGSRVSGDLAIVGGASAGYNTLKKVEDVVVANKASAESGIADLRTEITGTINVAIANLQSEDVVINARIDTEVSDRETAVSNEETARISAVSTVSSALSQEIADRTGADASAKVAYEAADVILQNNIASEATARQLADSTEASARQADVATLNGKVNTEIAERIAAVSGVQAAVNTEVTNRTSADAAHDLRLSSLETGYATGTKFKGAIADLAAFDAMTEADMEAGWTYIVANGSTGSTDVYVILSDASGEYVPTGWTIKSVKWMMDASDVTNLVTIERTQRVAGDSQVQNNVNTLDAKVDSNKTLVDSAVATLRTDMENANAAASTGYINADAVIQASLDAEISNRQTAVAATDANLATEIAAREAAISAEAGARTVAIDAVQANLDAETTARSLAVTAESEARSNADAAGATALTNEITARQNADSSEQTARIAGDVALSGRLDVVEGDELVAGSVRKALFDAKKYADLWIPMPKLEGQDGSLLVVGDTVTTTYVPYRGLDGISMGEVILYAPDGQSMMVSVQNVVGNVLTLAVGLTGEYAGWSVKVQYWFVNADQGGSGVGVAGEGGAGE